MSDIKPKKPDDHANNLLDVLGAEEVQNGDPPFEDPTDVCFGNENLAANFSREEIKVAQSAAAEVIRCSKAVGKSVYDLAAAAVKFRDGCHYLALGFESFGQWYAYEGFAPSALNQYMAIYEALTAKYRIEVERYQSIDIAKSRGILKLIKAGVDSKEMQESLMVADDMTLEDWIAWSDDAVDNHNAGLDVGALIESRPQSAKSSTSQTIEPGYYMLTKVLDEDIGLASPELNGNLKRLKGLKGAIFLDTVNNLKVVRVTG